MSSEDDHDRRGPDADEWAPEPGPERTPLEPVEQHEAPEAVRAAEAARRRATGTSKPAADARRVRGVEWVRPTDLLARHGSALAGRGIDFEVELARRTRTPLTSGARHLGERARRLPPLSAFGRGPTGQAPPARPGVGMS